MPLSIFYIEQLLGKIIILFNNREWLGERVRKRCSGFFECGDGETGYDVGRWRLMYTFSVCVCFYSVGAHTRQRTVVNRTKKHVNSIPFYERKNKNNKTVVLRLWCSLCTVFRMTNGSLSSEKRTLLGTAQGRDINSRYSCDSLYNTNTEYIFCCALCYRLTRAVKYNLKNNQKINLLW